MKLMTPQTAGDLIMNNFWAFILALLLSGAILFIHSWDNLEGLR